MTRLADDILEFADLLLGDGTHDVLITAQGRAARLTVARALADRACKIELDLACLEAVAAEIDPLTLATAAGDATLVESDGERARREALDARALPPGGVRALDGDDPLLEALRADRICWNVVPFPLVARPAICDGRNPPRGAA